MYSLPMTSLDKLSFTKKPSKGIPVVRKASFTLSETGDTYLDMRNWGKGAVWINGKSLGRYWEIGPQQTIYVPAEWLIRGVNQVVVFELLRTDETVLKTVEKPVLDQLKN